MCPIYYQEFKVMVMEMSKNKSPEPNVLNIGSFQGWWSFLGGEIHALVEESRQTQSLW